MGAQTLRSKEDLRGRLDRPVHAAILSQMLLRRTPFFGQFRHYFLSSLCLFRDLLNVISMRASGPKDLVRHG